MAEHTAAPWAVDGNKALGAYAVYAADWVKICEFEPGSNVPPRHERDANARLIAAAPDLLALLEELIDIEGPLPGNAEWAKKVSAAIAKAKGEPCTPNK